MWKKGCSPWRLTENSFLANASARMGRKKNIMWKLWWDNSVNCYRRPQWPPVSRSGCTWRHSGSTLREFIYSNLADPHDLLRLSERQPVNNVQNPRNARHQQSLHQQHSRLKCLQPHIVKIGQEQGKDADDHAPRGHGICENLSKLYPDDPFLIGVVGPEFFQVVKKLPVIHGDGDAPDITHDSCGGQRYDGNIEGKQHEYREHFHGVRLHQYFGKWGIFPVAGQLGVVHCHVDLPGVAVLFTRRQSQRFLMGVI